VAKKREPDSMMELDIDGKKIDLSVYLGKEASEGFKEIRYELTSEKAIEPLDAAYCLSLLLKSMCIEAGTTIEALMSAYNVEPISTMKH
jgi:hypothetical protein